MKLEVEITGKDGKVRNHPVHRLDRQEKNWSARYTTIRNGQHVTRKVMIGDNVKLIVKMEEGGK